MIQHSDGSWSHKHGVCPTEIFVGEDPGAVAWDLPDINEPLFFFTREVEIIGSTPKYYDSDPYYFAVSKTGGS
jgi:hypothetical protein